MQWTVVLSWRLGPSSVSPNKQHLTLRPPGTLAPTLDNCQRCSQRDRRGQSMQHSDSGLSAITGSRVHRSIIVPPRLPFPVFLRETVVSRVLNLKRPIPILGQWVLALRTAIASTVPPRNVCPLPPYGPSDCGIAFGNRRLHSKPNRHTLASTASTRVYS